MGKKKIEIKGLAIAIETIGKGEYVSLTDLARHGSGEPKHVIINWMRSNATLLFLEAWEQMHNPNFKGVEMHTFFRGSGDQRIDVSPQRFIAATGAVGLVSKSGRNGGTWAHSDIALQFCYWLSPPFQVYFVKEFQRLKEEEAKRLSIEWEAQRVKDLLDEARVWMDSILPPERRIDGPA